MEASFVDQLYDSIDYDLHRSYSDQFKVLQGGCWKKIDFERPGFRQNKRDRSSCFMASPWIQHFRSGSKPRVVIFKTMLHRKFPDAASPLNPMFQQLRRTEPNTLATSFKVSSRSELRSNPVHGEALKLI